MLKATPIRRQRARWVLCPDQRERRFYAQATIEQPGKHFLLIGYILLNKGNNYPEVVSGEAKRNTNLSVRRFYADRIDIDYTEIGAWSPYYNCPNRLLCFTQNTCKGACHER